jgi:hypothetical protein
MPFQGTRETKSFQWNHPSGQRSHIGYNADKGMSKRVTPTFVSFAGTNISTPDTVFGVFKVGDRIDIAGTTGGLNNGERLILAVTPTSMTVDWPAKTEGPVAGIEIRTP